MLARTEKTPAPVGPRERAHHATRLFWWQRLTSLALVPLALFAVVLVLALAGEDHGTVTEILGRPVIALPLLAVLAVVVWHMQIGMQEIIDDYVHGPVARRLAIVGNLAFAVAVGGLSTVALIRLFLGT